MDKYVSKFSGARQLQHFNKMHPSESILNIMTLSDIVYSILCYENGQEVWLERLKLKRMDCEEKDAFRKKAKLRYHVCTGSKLKAFRDGWTESGRTYYSELLKLFQDMKNDTLFWDKVVSHWKSFMRKNRNKSYIVKTLGLLPQHLSSAEDDFGREDEDDDAASFDISLPDDDDEFEDL